MNVHHIHRERKTKHLSLKQLEIESMVLIVKNGCISDIIRKVVKEELQNHEKNITKLIQSKLRATNKHIEETSTGRCGLMKSLEFIVFCFKNFKVNENVLTSSKKLKNTGIYLYQNFSRNTVELTKNLWE